MDPDRQLCRIRSNVGRCIDSALVLSAAYRVRDTPQRSRRQCSWFRPGVRSMHLWAPSRCSWKGRIAESLLRFTAKSLGVRLIALRIMRRNLTYVSMWGRPFCSAPRNLPRQRGTSESIWWVVYACLGCEDLVGAEIRAQIKVLSPAKGDATLADVELRTKNMQGIADQKGRATQRRRRKQT